MLSELFEKFMKSENFDELNNILFILSEMLNKYDRINYGKELIEHFMQFDFNCFFTCLLEEVFIFSLNKSYLF